MKEPLFYPIRYTLTRPVIGGAPTPPGSVLTKWFSALEGQTAGTTSPRLLLLGDSTTFGVGSNNGIGTDLVTNNYPSVLTSLFSANSRPAQSNAFIGGGSNIFERTMLNDPRVIPGAGWGAATQTSTFGNCLANTSNANVLSFTPTVNTDSFKVSYLRFTASTSTLRMNINGGANTDVSTVGANALLSQSITSTVGPRVLNISKLSGASLFFASIEAWDSTKKEIAVLTAGWPGVRSSNAVDISQAWSPLNTINYYTQDLTLVMIGINDWNNAVPVATYKSNMQTLIDTLKSGTGDVVLVTPVPTRTTVTPLATQQLYVTALQELAVTNSLQIFDLFSNWVSWEVSNPLGRYNDNIHPSSVGYSDVAQFIYNQLASINGV